MRRVGKWSCKMFVKFHGYLLLLFVLVICVSQSQTLHKAVLESQIFAKPWKSQQRKTLVLPSFSSCLLPFTIHYELKVMCSQGIWLRPPRGTSYNMSQKDDDWPVVMCKGKTGFSLGFPDFLQIKFFKNYGKEIILQSVISWKLMVLIPQVSLVWMVPFFAVGVGLTVGLLCTTALFSYRLRYVQLILRFIYGIFQINFFRNLCQFMDHINHCMICNSCKNEAFWGKFRGSQGASWLPPFSWKSLMGRGILAPPLHINLSLRSLGFTYTDQLHFQHYYMLCLIKQIRIDWKNVSG